jgi:ceramide glucosyltransferase
MNPNLLRYVLLLVATFPFIYYAIAIYSSVLFFRRPQRDRNETGPRVFTPTISILKPVRGVDPDAYENFASFCQQDYPEDYEIVFCVDGETAPILPILNKLCRNFPERRIRILYGSGRTAANDKVAKLVRLVNEAAYETLVINDSDVRVRPDYLRTVVAPLAKETVGAVTCFYVPIGETKTADVIQSVGMVSDFYPGILVARQLDGIKFALGPTIATTRTHLAKFGGYEAIENRPADDLLVGRLIAEQGYEVVLLPYAIDTVADFNSISELFHKRLRWIVVMRHMRPAGHFGLIFTFGLPWSIIAFALQPSLPIACLYFGAYVLLRSLMTSLVGAWGLKQRSTWSRLPLIPVWDLLALTIWLLSFTRNTIRWRNADYYIRDGQLVPAQPEPVEAAATDSLTS